MADFADPSDIAAQWRTLSTEEESRATALLPRASAIIREAVPSVDDRVTAGSLDAELPKGVAVDMVVRVLDRPTDDVTSVTTDDTTFRWETGRGGQTSSTSLHITDAEVALLAGTRRRPRVGTIHARPTLQP